MNCNQNIKVLFLLHLPPPVHGAAMVGLSIKESVLINESFNCRYINLGLSASIDGIGKNGFGKGFRYFSLLGQVVKKLIKFKPQICYITIQVHRIGFYKDLPVAMLAKLFGVKVVYHFHNKGVSTRQNKFLDNLLYHLVFKNTDIILLSKFLYPDIQKYVPLNRIHYCPNGIPEKQIKKVKLKGEKERVEILFLSNLIESKGVFVLLKACQILRCKKINFHCTFAGGVGDINEPLFNGKVRELKLTQNVKYVGKKYGTEKELEFAKADIFAFPSYYHNETFGLVNLEAMQYNLPIVSTFEGGIPDVVEDGVTGFLVPQQDASALANKLEILINDSELRKQMGFAGRAKYEKEFTLQIFEKKLQTILKQIILGNN